jgi:hypothetical protein
MGLLVPCLIALASGSSNASAADTVRAKQLLEQYRIGSAPLVSAYQHARIVAAVHHSFALSGNHRDWTMELLQSGDRYKVTEYPDPTDAALRRSIHVLTPESQFWLAEEDDGKLRRSRPAADAFLDLAQARDQLGVRIRVLQSPYSFLEAPLVEWFARVNLSGRSMATEKSAGRELLRVHLSYEPPAHPEQGISHSEGWFLFEPGAHWALHGFELRHRTRKDPVPFRFSGSFEYGTPEGEIPILRQARLQFFGRDGALTSEERADIHSVEFRPSPRAEFTLSGSGYNINAEPAERVDAILKALLWGSIVTPAAIAILLLLGRRTGSARADPVESGKLLPRPGTMRLLGRATIAAWAAAAAAILLLWSEHRLLVLHPPGVVLLLLIGGSLAASLACVLLGFWNVIGRPNQPRSLAWMLAGVLPLLLWVSWGLTAYRNEQKRLLFESLPMALMMRVGHSVMQTQALYLYPRRLESEHLVMFYADRMSDPKGDLKLMEDHVVHLSDMIGKPLRSKIYWVRGQLVGRGGLCVNGMALGSNASPAGPLDRHELAHAVLYQYDSPDTDPPSLLGEGWAECQSTPSGLGAHQAFGYRAARRAWLEHCSKVWPTFSPTERRDILACFRDGERLGRDLANFSSSQGAFSTLRELTDDYWYHRDEGPVYTVGNGFVDFLIRRFGVPRFVDFYHACRPGGFESACRDVYGTDLDELEKQFWEDSQKMAAKP